MRVVMLSWEYPPNMVGGLGRHVDELSRALTAAGHEVHVVTHGVPDAPELGVTSGMRNGVHVHRAAADPINISFATETLLSWSQAQEHSLTRAALRVVGQIRPDVIHAHDWLVAQTAMTLADVTGLPLVTTIHATEAGRNMGWLATELQRGIHSIERWLVRESSETIACSHFMAEELAAVYQIDAGTVHVIGNGIDLDPWRRDEKQAAATRETYPASGPLLAYAGRLIHAKGLQTLIEAMPDLAQNYPGLHLVVAGTGPYEEELRKLAEPVDERITWAGFLSDADVAATLWAADAAVVPSLYEPFGLIAAEAAAAGTPLVVADTGGLRDLVDHERTGLRFEPGSVAGLISALRRLLDDPTGAHTRASRAEAAIGAWTWAQVAAQTADVYSRAVQALSSTDQ